MLLARSVAFFLAFHLTTAVFVIVGSPLLFGPRRWAMAGLALHARVCLALLQRIAGTRLEVRGRHHLPDGPVLVAAKHQSAWDTFGLIPEFRDPVMIMKAELGLIPFYGWFARKFEHILVARERGPSALKAMLREAKDRIAGGREIVIFPEGTRRPIGAAPDYKPGVMALYEALSVPCVPVALNSGLYWRNGSIQRLPGTIVVEFLEPIGPGLERARFRDELITRIETATARLVAEAAASGVAAVSVEPNKERTKVDSNGSRA